MQRRRLGRNGLQVTDLCLGTMTFGLQCDEKTSFAILDAAAEAGLTFLDTADGYPLGGGLDSAGRTEEIIGRWMATRGNRDRVILATKCWAPMRRGPNGYGLSRQHIMEAVEASLRRLDTEYIDLYQAHAFDPDVPIEETLRAFDDLQRSGKVRYAGCSNYPAWRLGEALATAERHGLSGYASVQPRYNMLYREIETELLPLCRHRGLGVLVYNPLAGGLLSGKYRSGEPPREGTRFTLGNAADRYQARYWQAVQLEAVERLQQAVTERGQDLVTVAVAWVLAQPGVTSAIIGASRPEQLPANLAASGFELDDELQALCDALWWSLPRQPVDAGYR
ncbi:MAG: aldo/keto reductase [Gammaproteobacteria bacterium]|nr:aldo/keto reductase [Gammaproteobacteria bacterium]